MIRRRSAVAPAPLPGLPRGTTVVLLALLLLSPAAAQAKLCRGEDEATCKDRPECQWAVRERPAAATRTSEPADAKTEFQCIARAVQDTAAEERAAKKRALPLEPTPRKKEPVEPAATGDPSRPTDGGAKTARPEKRPTDDEPSRADRRRELSDAEKEKRRRAALERFEERERKRKERRANANESSKGAREALMKQRDRARQRAIRKREEAERNR